MHRVRWTADGRTRPGGTRHPSGPRHPSVFPHRFTAWSRKTVRVMPIHGSAHRAAEQCHHPEDRVSGTARAVAETVSESRSTLPPQPHLRRGTARGAPPWLATDHDPAGGHHPPTKCPNTRPTQPGPVHDTDHGHNHRSLNKHPDSVQLRSTVLVRCMVACRAPTLVTCIGPSW